MKTSFLARLARPVDLTAGTPWRVILRYSAPIILSYLLQQIYVLADAAICGQVLHVEEVAGVNDTYALTYFFLQFAFGCAAGFSVVTAQAVGSGQTGRVRASLAAQSYLLLLISAALTALSVPLLPALLGLVNVTPADPAVYGAAYSYCLVIFLGIFAQMGYNLICGVLRAYGDAVTPLLFLLLSTLLNVGLDLLFLIPFGWGPAGAAAATVLAQLVSFAGCTVYTFARYPDLRPRGGDWREGRRELGLHLRQGLPLGAQFSILAVGIIVMQAGAVRFDLTDAGTLAADAAAQNGFGAATKLINFFFAIINGLSSGILGFNAQNFGRGDKTRVRRGTVQTLWLMLAACALCLLATWALTARGTYQYIFLSADKVSARSLQLGGIYVWLDLALYFIVGFLAVTRSAVQGVGRSVYVLGAGLSELVARVLICSLLPAAINGGPITVNASPAAFAALCLGDPGAWLAGSLFLLIPTVKYILKK